MFQFSVILHNLFLLKTSSPCPHLGIESHCSQQSSYITLTVKLSLYNFNEFWYMQSESLFSLYKFYNLSVFPNLFSTAFCTKTVIKLISSNIFWIFKVISFQPPDFGYLILWMWMPVISLFLTPVSVYRNLIECKGWAWMPFCTLSTQTKGMSLFWNFMGHLCHSHKTYYCFVSGHFYVFHFFPTRL